MQEPHTDGSQHRYTLASVLIERHFDRVSSSAPSDSTFHPLIATCFVEVNYVLSLPNSPSQSYHKGPHILPVLVSRLLVLILDDYIADLVLAVESAQRSRI